MRSGVLAEFSTPEALSRAYGELERAGYTRLTTWTPYPVKEIQDRLRPSIVPWIMLAAGLVGGSLGYLIQWWCNAVSFPIDVGGRPLDSVPAFIPITFESAVLSASVVGFLLMIGMCGLPRLNHPVFRVDGIESAGVDRFWLGVEETDPRFDESVLQRLSALGALRCERLGAAP